MGDYPNDSSRIRTYDRLLRRQLLYPAELLSQVMVPIAANPEPSRGLPQLSGFPPNSYIIEGVLYLVNPLPVVLRIGDYM